MQRNRFLLFVGALMVILSSVLLMGSLPGRALAHAAGPTADWATYLHDPGHSGFNNTETILNPNSASQLKARWSINAGNTISTQAVIANGLVYWGSWDGVEHATNQNGSQAWATNLGVAPSNCGGSLGVLSTATVATVPINGTQISAVFVGSANDQFYALNAATGAILWQTSVGTPPADVLWSSPVLYNGSLYLGIASNDCPLVQGRVLRLNASTGAIQNTFTTVPNGCVGPGVWGSVTVDVNNGTLYFATGNPGPCSQAEPYADAVVKLDASTLALLDAWQIPLSQQGIDLDFGSTPTLFPATIAGTVHNLLGVADKNGTYYAFDEANLAQGPVWAVPVAETGQDPVSGGGSISPSAWDGTNLYVGGGKTIINGQFCMGGLRALNPATGSIVWQRCATEGPIIGAVTAVPGVVAVGEGNALWLVASSDGHDLFKAVDSSPNSQYFEGPTIANGVLYIGNSNGHFSAVG